MKRSIFIAVVAIGCVATLTGCTSRGGWTFFSHEPTKRSIIAVMIENQETARKYHKGIGQAQMVIEMLVEGGISRFAVLFDKNDLPPVMGPIRSLRPYFIDAALPYTKTIVHAGGSPEAFDEAGSIASLTTINALRYGKPDIFFRDSDVPAPHNLFAKKEGLVTLLPESTIISWPPYETGNWSSKAGTGARTIDVNFLSKNHNIEWTYDRWHKTYTRINGGTESELHPNNVLMLEAPITEIGEYGRLTIPLEGTGKAYIFRDGLMQEGRWKKDARDHAFRFMDHEGNIIPLAEGTTWMTVLATLERVSWK